MKVALALLLFAATAPVPEARYFHYQRAVQTAPGSTQSCFALDADVFANASPGVADVRLYLREQEVPFAIRTANAPATASHPLLPLNLGVRGGRTEFDAAMPPGTYSDVELEISGQDFQAKVEVTGSQTAGSSDARRVGTYTIFDLTRERSGRSTVLHLPASNFRYLHFAIDGPIGADAVNGIVVLPAADAPQPPYVPVAQTAIALSSGRTTALTFSVPAHVPVDRVLFQPGGEPPQFSRSVTVKVTPSALSQTDEHEAEASTYSGVIQRLQHTEDSATFYRENFAVGLPGRTHDAPQTWTVVVENGDDHPLQLGTVRLEMLQRELCFGPVVAASYTLRYGDAGLAAPQYDYASTLAGKAAGGAVVLGPQQTNAAWQQRPDQRAFTERHPLLLWTALLATIVLLGAVALRSRGNIQV